MNSKQKKNEVKTWRPLVNVLFTLLFCVVFPFVWWLFATVDYHNQKITNLAICISVIVIYSLLIIGLNILLHYFKVLNIRSYNFNIPILSVFLWIILTSYIPKFNIYARVGVAITVVVVITLIVNFTTGKIEDNMEKKAKQLEEEKLKKEIEDLNK